MDAPLQTLIQRLADGEPVTMEALASELNTGIELLDMMLTDLERAGYIQPVTMASCSHKCADCASKQGCGLKARGRMWAVTAKGFRYAGRTPTGS